MRGQSTKVEFTLLNPIAPGSIPEFSRKLMLESLIDIAAGENVDFRVMIKKGGGRSSQGV